MIGTMKTLYNLLKPALMGLLFLTLATTVQLSASPVMVTLRSGTEMPKEVVQETMNKIENLLEKDPCVFYYVVKHAREPREDIGPGNIPIEFAVIIQADKSLLHYNIRDEELTSMHPHERLLHATGIHPIVRELVQCCVRDEGSCTCLMSPIKGASCAPYIVARPGAYPGPCQRRVLDAVFGLVLI